MGTRFVPGAERLEPRGSSNTMDGIGGPRATCHATVSKPAVRGHARRAHRQEGEEPRPVRHEARPPRPVLPAGPQRAGPPGVRRHAQRHQPQPPRGGQHPGRDLLGPRRRRPDRPRPVVAPTPDVGGVPRRRQVVGHRRPFHLPRCAHATTATTWSAPSRRTRAPPVAACGGTTATSRTARATGTPAPSPSPASSHPPSPTCWHRRTTWNPATSGCSTASPRRTRPRTTRPSLQRLRSSSPCCARTRPWSPQPPRWRNWRPSAGSLTELNAEVDALAADAPP